MESKQCVLVNEDGHLYAGFSSETSRPVWAKLRREECVLDEPMADSVLRQLTQLGFTKIAKRDAFGIARKWVPQDLDASAA